MMPSWIENCSKKDVARGCHYDVGPNAMLIQIADPASGFPKPLASFREIHRFEFLDAEVHEDYPEEAKFSDAQAAEIAGLLKRALECRMNVLVHCHAGICRSGAVVEVASMMGFRPTDRYRQPNLLVKHKLMKALGWGYEEGEGDDEGL